MLLGPTASGKSGCALAIAARLPCEIISVDSAAVYRGMDAGTAKPSAKARSEVPHHLIDIIEPTATYSAARFRSDAKRLIGEISGRGRIPLLAGGTMLYVKALLEGLDTLPAADAAVRAAIDREAALRGWPALHAELAQLDAATAARLKPNDAQRIQRALEVVRLSGRPMSELHGTKVASGLRFLTLALLPSDRLVLHQRIESRFDAMLEAGLVDELRRLRQRCDLRQDMPSMRSVGYRQAWQFLDGAIDRATLRARGVAASRQLAKRQLTWLRSMPKFTVFDCLEQQLEISVAEFAAAQWAARIH
jgi:tRNA dimethylallyltransferase